MIKIVSRTNEKRVSMQIYRPINRLIMCKRLCLGELSVTRDEAESIFNIRSGR